MINNEHLFAGESPPTTQEPSAVSLCSTCRRFLLPVYMDRVCARPLPRRIQKAFHRREESSPSPASYRAAFRADVAANCGYCASERGFLFLSNLQSVE